MFLFGKRDKHVVYCLFIQIAEQYTIPSPIEKDMKNVLFEIRLYVRVCYLFVCIKKYKNKPSFYGKCTINKE